MRTARLSAFAALAAAAVVLAGCSGPTPSPSAPTSPSEPTGPSGTFTLASSADAGALDPHVSPPVSTLLQLAAFAYDPLVNIDAEGTISSGLATQWTVEGTTVTMTIGDGITCSDGTPFTAETAAKNLAFIGDPANASPMLGVFYPAGATAAADGSTLTITLAGPSPFVLGGLANLSMICESGLADRSTLTGATAGTGPYVLTEAVPNDHYTLTLREGYAWGPGGVTNTEPGMPAEVVVQIIPNETTSANLLLAGDINAATIIGPDAERMEAANLFSTASQAIVGQQWYNHGDGHVTAEPAVRTALVQALDLAELQQVITSGKGSEPTTFATVAPASCVGSPIPGALQAHDPAAAAAALDAAGWSLGADGVRSKGDTPLAITFLHDTALGTGGSAAAELAVAAWTALGVKVEALGQPTDQLAGALFGTGGWDVAWEPLNVNSPDMLVGYLSGPTLADGGGNFASIANPGYEAAVADAMGKTGDEACAAFFSGEAALTAAADVTVFANNVLKVYANGAEFSHAGWVIPTSIRLAG